VLATVAATVLGRLNAKALNHSPIWRCVAPDFSYGVELLGVWLVETVYPGAVLGLSATRWKRRRKSARGLVVDKRVDLRLLPRSRSVKSATSALA